MAHFPDFTQSGTLGCPRAMRQRARPLKELASPDYKVEIMVVAGLNSAPAPAAEH